VQKLIILPIIFIIVNNSNLNHHVCINEDIHQKWKINVSLKFWNQRF
jgi:hypothetical protein